MKTTGIRQFKAHLSSYLREVQSGETVLVTDRGRVVAEVKSPGAESRVLQPDVLRYHQAVESGLIRPAKKSHREIRNLWKGFRGLRLPRGIAESLLNLERADKE